MLCYKMKSVFVKLFYYIFTFNIQSLDVFGKIEYNTHPTVHVRSTLYSPKLLSVTCLLKPEIGPCRANIAMFYYDPKLKRCEQFRWGGCQGNGNRFDSNTTCQDFCLSQPNPKKTRPKWCTLSFDYGFCFGAIKRWYYDRLWKVCKETIYSGCGGNKNNFYNLEQCESTCRFGLGPKATTSKSSDGLKKVLIVNPWDTTIKRGRDQSAKTVATTVDANVTEAE